MRSSNGPASRGPFDERILGRQHARLPALVHEALVVRHTTLGVGPLPRGPQVVIARHPDHPGEPRRDDVEHELQLRGRVTGVAAENQPVVGVGRQRLHRAAVGLVADVQIADGPERHGGGVRGAGRPGAGRRCSAEK